jgi:general secretion pathway protein G
MAPKPSSRSRGGFTLIEMLVVITIVIMLVGLLLAGIFYAFSRMNQTTTIADISQLGASLQGFKAKYGVYPPSRIRLCGDYDQYALKPTPAANGGPQLDSDSIAFINRMFPRIGLTVWSVTNNKGAGINWAGNGVLVDEILEGDQCLVFFLGGIPSPVAATNPQQWAPPSGFSTSPKDPSAVSSGAGVVPTFFSFDNNRLKLVPGRLQNNPGSNFASYIDVYGQAPYLYFSSYNLPNGYAKSYFMSTMVFGVQPYSSAANKYWNPNSFQIIAAGADGQFGNTPGGLWTVAQAEIIYPAGNTGADDLTNFYDAPLGVTK